MESDILNRFRITPKKYEEVMIEKQMNGRWKVRWRRRGNKSQERKRSNGSKNKNDELNRLKMTTNKKWERCGERKGNTVTMNSGET